MASPWGPSGETERRWGDPDNWIRIELGEHICLQAYTVCFRVSVCVCA